MQEENYQNDEINLMDYVKVIRKRKKIIVGILFACVLTTTVTIFLAPKVYEASAVIRLGIIDEFLISKENAIYIVRGQKILDSTIKKLKLDTDATKLKKMVKVKDIPDTGLIEFSVRNTNPDLAAKICHSIADTFILQGQKIYEERVALANEEIKRTEEKIKSIEKQSEKLNEGLVSKTFTADFPLIQNTLFSYESIMANLEQKVFTLKKELISAKGFELFEAPVKPEDPISLNIKQLIIISTISGLLLGVFIAFSMEFWEKQKYLEGKKK